MTDSKSVSEYESKRLRRIEENREKLRTLDLPSIPSIDSTLRLKKRRRNGNGKPGEPTRKSPRQREQWQQHLKQEQHVRSKRERQEGHQLVKLEKKMRREGNDFDETLLIECQKLQQCDEQSLDWRLKRKLQGQTKKRRVLGKRRAEWFDEHEKEARVKQKAAERELRKKQKERERLERFFRKELEKQQRFEELELMKQEDLEAQELVRQQKKAEKERLRLEKDTARIAARRLKKSIRKRDVERKEEEKINRRVYPVRQIDLPFVRILPPTVHRVAKSCAQLKVDTRFFHGFSLGKQFLPPGKQTVMQGLCPGGYTAIFRNDWDLHVWNNALTLFVNGTTGMFYRHMLEEVTLRGRKFVVFRWSRCEDVTPAIVERLRRVRRGDEWLRFDQTYFDSAEVSDPEPLLLFLQYPKVRLLSR